MTFRQISKRIDQYNHKKTRTIDTESYLFAFHPKALVVCSKINGRSSDLFHLGAFPAKYGQWQRLPKKILQMRTETYSYGDSS